MKFKTRWSAESVKHPTISFTEHAPGAATTSPRTLTKANQVSRGRDIVQHFLVCRLLLRSLWGTRGAMDLARSPTRSSIPLNKIPIACNRVGTLLVGCNKKAFITRCALNTRYAAACDLLLVASPPEHVGVGAFFHYSTAQMKSMRTLTQRRRRIAAASRVSCLHRRHSRDQRGPTLAATHRATLYSSRLAEGRKFRHISHSEPPRRSVRCRLLQHLGRSWCRIERPERKHAKGGSRVQDPAGRIFRHKLCAE